MTANTRGFGRTGVPEADLILEAARGLRRAWSEGLVDHDLSPHESRALRVIARRCGGEEGAPRLADLATALRIAPRSATEVVDRLVSHGLAVRQPSPTDRRAIEVVATEAGLAAASAAAVLCRGARSVRAGSATGVPRPGRRRSRASPG